MAKKFRRIFAIAMVMCMFVSVLPMQALATDDGVTTGPFVDGDLSTYVTTYDPVITNGDGSTTSTVTEKAVTTGTNPEGATVNQTETTQNYTTTDENGQLLAQGTIIDGIRVEVKESERTDTDDSSSGPVKNEVQGPELSVDFEDTLGEDVTAEDSKNPNPAEPGTFTGPDTENKTVSTTVTQDSTGKTTTVTTIETTTPGTSTITNTVGPNDNGLGGTTTIVTEETVDKVVETTVTTTVVTDRTLEATLNQDENTVVSNGDAVEALAKDTDLSALYPIIEDLGFDTSALTEADAEAILAGLKAEENATGDDYVAQIINALRANGGAAVLQPGAATQGEGETAQQITVSEVTFKVKDKIEGKEVNSDEDTENDVYDTELSFKIEVVTDAEGTTTVSILDVDNQPVYDTNGNEITNINLADLTLVDGKYVFSNLQLSENQAYNLQFNFTGTRNLPEEQYTYSSNIQTPVYDIVNKPVDNNDGTVSSNGTTLDKDDASPKNAGSKFHSTPGTKLGLPEGYYVVTSGDNKFLGYIKNVNDGQFNVGTKKGEETNYVFGTDLEAEYTVDFVHESGRKGQITFKFQQQNAGDNGTTNYTVYKVVFAEIDKYDPYSFEFEKSQTVSAGKNMALEFSVDESTETVSSSVNTVKDITVTETTTTTWHSEDGETFTPVANPPADNPPAVYRLANQNGVEEIADEEVPLAAPVATGSNSFVIWLTVVMAAMFGLAVLNLRIKRRPRGKHEAI